MRRTRWWIAGVASALALASSAAADPLLVPNVDHGPVDVLRDTETRLAVSSSAADLASGPEQLVDADPRTRWSPRATDASPWIAVRVPASAHVVGLRLVGNAKRVRVTSGGTSTEATVVTTPRGAPRIPLDLPGGDLRIDVLEPAASTLAIGTIEVWAETSSDWKQHTPDLRTGSLDAPPTASFADCLTAIYPAARDGRIGDQATDDTVVDWDVVAFDTNLAVCRIDHHSDATGYTYVEVAPVSLGARWKTLGARRSLTTMTAQDGGTTHAWSVALTRFALTSTDAAVIVDFIDHATAPYGHADKTASTLLRVRYSMGFVELAAWESLVTDRTDGAPSTHDACKLVPPVKLGPRMPPLALTCDVAAKSTQLQWDGAAYVPHR